MMERKLQVHSDPLHLSVQHMPLEAQMHTGIAPALDSAFALAHGVVLAIL